jgi:hypothetical protein
MVMVMMMVVARAKHPGAAVPIVAVPQVPRPSMVMVVMVVVSGVLGRDQLGWRSRQLGVGGLQAFDGVGNGLEQFGV